jgi:hypothetical protein
MLILLNSLFVMISPFTSGGFPADFRSIAAKYVEQRLGRYFKSSKVLV